MSRIDKIDRRTDVVFLLFHHANTIVGVTKVQKLLFLIENETAFFEAYKDSIAFNFAPYRMGPFSEHVYEELEFMLSLSAIESESINTSNRTNDSNLGQKRYTITPKGEKIATQLSELLEPEYNMEIADLVADYNELPLHELLEYVYQEYPGYAAESEIKSELGIDEPVSHR